MKPNAQDLVITKLRNELGWDFLKISRLFDRESPQWACFRYHRAREQLESVGHWAATLSVRTANILANAKLESREEVLAAVRDGRLRPGPGAPRLYGERAHREVLRFLGIKPAPLRPERPTIICPGCGCGIRLQIHPRAKKPLEP